MDKEKNLKVRRKTYLGSICKITMGQSPPSSSYNEDGYGTPLIQGNADIVGGKTIRRVFTTEPNKFAKKGDIILTVRAPVGELGRATEDICIGRGVCSISCGQEVIAGYVWAFLIAQRLRWKKLEQGSTFSAINGVDIRGVEMELPPLPEQKRIVRILETWDDAIQDIRILILAKTRIATRIISDLVTGRVRLVGFDKEWQIKPLHELIRYERPDRYIVKSTEYSDDYETPVLTANKGFILGYTDEKDGIYSDVPAIIFDDFTTASKYVDFPFKVKSSAIKVLKPKTAKTNLRFVYERMQLIPFVVGEHKRNYISDYQYEEFRLPDITEQNAIADAAASADLEIKLLVKKLNNLEKQKTYLLNNLVTGNLRTPEEMNA